MAILVMFLPRIAVVAQRILKLYPHIFNSSQQLIKIHKKFIFLGNAKCDSSGSNYKRCHICAKYQSFSVRIVKVTHS